MGPVATVVLQAPDFRGSLLRGCPNFVHVEELLVDGPASVVVTKHPPPGFDDLTRSDRRRKIAQLLRNLTVIRCRRITIYVKPQNRCAWAPQLFRRAGPVLVHQAVLEE